MKKMIVLLTMLLCIASSCFAAEERSTKDIFADTTIANVDDKNGTDSWIYIIMEDGTVGWVFGAYARIEGNVDVQ